MKTVDHIKSGFVASYGKIARASGGSPRSVGQVMRLNPYPLIIPCHRVIRSDFSIGGYSRDIRGKLELLIREKRGRDESLMIFFCGKNLEIFPVELALNKQHN